MIDTTLDLRSDARGDADTYSATLRRYHRLLWSKPLPGGAMFDLEEAGRPGSYHLRHSSELGDFKLSSDAITNRLLKQAKRVVAQIPPEQLPPHRGYTIGSAILFPKTAPEGRMTINKARGMRRVISDRFDLTLECIRLHYLGDDSPLADVLADQSDFFGLFEDFRGYVDFWLLQDLVDGEQVRFWLPFDDFGGRAVPQDVDSYLAYSHGREEFITARNARIADHASGIAVPRIGATD
jgi:hypothetical protein